VNQCLICGHEEALEHSFENGVCSCGAYKNYAGYYLVGEKPDLSKKADSIADFFTPVNPASIPESFAKSSWQSWNDTKITFDLRSDYHLFFKSYSQLIATNPGFAEQAKSVGEVSTGTKPEWTWDGETGVVDNLDRDFIVALNRYLKRKGMALDSDFFHIQGAEQIIQQGQGFFSYVPKWKIAIFFFHKKQAGAAARFDPFLGSGVCDVCNKSLGDTKAYIVPNDVFYNSPRYRLSFRINLCRFTSENVSDAAAAQMFAEMQAKDTGSQGSAVCEDCVHMFE
jgi:hypothetical protein